MVSMRIKNTELRTKEQSKCLLLLSSVFFVLFSIIPNAFACPLCKEAIGKMGEIWTAVGFNWSIYFMMAIPYLLVGTFAGVLYLNYRKQKKKQ